ncbi:hypothetical protein CDEST_00708 [Colletotrichum destructivum]|uniref:Uncharacterized protein n=1 Tax=Colletotrichum destructivum TaxID=34406 RepID=A0AAX4HXA5_9PEZI|nr:hypothetical protein CDEST_00708 [Colletotrichum destructivum]
MTSALFMALFPLAPAVRGAVSGDRGVMRLSSRSNCSRLDIHRIEGPAPPSQSEGRGCVNGKQTAFPRCPALGRPGKGGLCFLLIASCLSQPQNELVVLLSFYGLNRRRRWARPLKRNDDPNSNPRLNVCLMVQAGGQGLPFVCHINLDDGYWTDMATLDG